MQEIERRGRRRRRSTRAGRGGGRDKVRIRKARAVLKGGREAQKGKKRGVRIAKGKKWGESGYGNQGSDELGGQTRSARQRVERMKKQGKSVMRVGTGGVVGGIRSKMREEVAERARKKKAVEEAERARKKKREERTGSKRGRVTRIPGQKRSFLGRGGKEGRIGAGRLELQRKQKEKGKVVRVDRSWVSGRLTNHRKYVDYVKWYRKERTYAKQGGIWPSEAGEAVLVSETKRASGVSASERKREASEARLRGEKGEVEKKRTKEDRWYEKNRKGREEWLVTEAERPGVIVFRNAGEHEVGRHEAIRCGVPTVGRVSGKTKMERKQKRTYAREWPAGERGSVMRGQRRRRLTIDGEVMYTESDSERDDSCREGEDGVIGWVGRFSESDYSKSKS
jgi:hypothetical protein